MNRSVREFPSKMNLEPPGSSEHIMGFPTKFSARLAALFACALGFSACLIQPAPLPETRPTNGPLRLIVNEGPLERVVCEAFSSEAEIHCGGPRTWSPEELGQGRVAVIDARIVSSSRDLLRNTGLSLASMTTLLMVSTSGTVEYGITLRKGPAGFDRPRRTTLHGRGRVGMWSVIPFYTGLVGTWIGTAMNEYRRPERLRAACMTPGMEPDLPPDFDPCAEYRTFLMDSYARVHAPLREILSAARHEGGQLESMAAR